MASERWGLTESLDCFGYRVETRDSICNRHGGGIVEVIAKGLYKLTEQVYVILQLVYYS